MTQHGIYVASRASVPERGAMWRALRAQGAPIVSSWIDEDGEGATDNFGDLWERICREVTGAAALILYAEPSDFPLKGAYIEVGMALAAGVPVYAVLPGVKLEPRSMRPVGSWLMHPLVEVSDSVDTALSAALARASFPAPRIVSSRRRAGRFPDFTGYSVRARQETSDADPR